MLLPKEHITARSRESRKNFSRVAPSRIFGTHLGEKERPEGQFACLRPDMTGRVCAIDTKSFSIVQERLPLRCGMGLQALSSPFSGEMRRLRQLMLAEGTT
ncbi:MAG: hypothetical protein A4E65_03680 [Syntrophorhabdus sp. PtaU1.Bin153]|nr:MAG: hypothetical protein A4E65_03680 [Syntrophorhabdus sp. PtaU1.Bin153]